MEDDPKIDNRVCLFYVADRLTELSDVKDKDLRKYVVEFREECLRCDGRFLRSDHEDKVCAFCDNDDLQDTIFLMPEEFDRCTCNQCTEIKEGAI